MSTKLTLVGFGLIIFSFAGCSGKRISAKVESKSSATVQSKLDDVSQSGAALLQDNTAEYGKCSPKISESAKRLAFITQPALVWPYQNRTGSNQLPDFVVRGFKRNNETCILIPHYELGLSCGPDLKTLNPVATKVYDSPNDTVFPNYNYHNWIVSPYVMPDGRIFGLTHSEWYQCLNYPNDPLRKCSTGTNQYNSWSNALSGFISADFGNSWEKISTIQRPAALSSTFPNMWTRELMHFGFFGPGNIVKQNNYYYAFSTYVGRNLVSGAVEKSGLVLLRTDNLLSPNWQQVKVGGEPVYSPNEAIMLPGTSTSYHAHFDMATVTFNTSLCKYLLTFWDLNAAKLRYTTFDSLENPIFGPIRDVANQETVAIPDNQSGLGLVLHGYPTSQIDPDSSGSNYEQTDSSFYMFLSSISPSNALNRSVYRAGLGFVDASEIPGIKLDEEPEDLVSVYRFSSVLGHKYSNNPDSFLGTDIKPEGAAFKLFRQNSEGRRPIFRCVNSSNKAVFLSVDSSCEGNGPHAGILGYLSLNKSSGYLSLLRCSFASIGTHLATVNAQECSSAGGLVEGVLGYIPTVSLVTVPVTADSLISVFRFSGAAGYQYSNYYDSFAGTRWKPEGVAFRLFKQNAANRKPLFRCQNLGNKEAFLSIDPACEGHGAYTGVMGYLSSVQGAGTRSLIRCVFMSASIHLATVTSEECKGISSVIEGTLGYAQ